MTKTKDRATLDAIYKAIEKDEIAIADGKVVRIRHWLVEKKLGEGSTATVLLARSLIDDTLVAIKLFKSEYFKDENKNDANQKMMRTEAALVGKIVHPNILQTYTVGINSKNKYLVMEFVGGGCLEEYVNPPKVFSISKLIKIFFQCSCAFQYSDEIGIIHRDIKPANILFTAEGIPKITDFGSSMIKGSDKSAVAGVGSPVYMSSEQIRQEQLNQQTDIYSLGASLYEMLTGQKPISAKTQKELIYKILFVEPPPISKFITSALPKGLEEIVQKCLKKKQEERFQNWAELINQFSKLIYNTAKPETYITKVDEVSAFDWVRKCSAMEEFEDSELWDLIQNGIIYKVVGGMAFKIPKIIDSSEARPSILKLNKEKITELKLVSAIDRKTHIENKGAQLIHTFVLSGAIQSYGIGGDGRIQILLPGDYCANIELIEKIDADTKIQAYSIYDTILLSVNEEEIFHIHPVVREKLDQLIVKSQQRQLSVLKQRHAKIDVHQAVKEAEMGLHLL